MSTTTHRASRLVPSELAFLRFVAGMRALLVMLGCMAASARTDSLALDAAVLLPYLAWTAVLLWRTLNGWPRAASRAWLWIDALALLVISTLIADALPMFGIATVLPVVAMAVLAGVRAALALAAACTLAILASSLAHFGIYSATPWLASSILVAIGPVAALLARPSRELRERLLLIETLSERSDPRQGLGHHVQVLLEQLAQHFSLSAAAIGVTGPEPRVFQWRRGGETTVLPQEQATRWREQFAAREQAATLTIQADNAMLLPLLNYGQTQSALLLSRRDPFSESELRFVQDVMREAMPLLERCDLLEQLQRETASRERERIGRDLHDSAVQPYLGLKYGLEALARQAGPDNPVARQIQQLVVLANDELRTLRDVVGGLRRGDDPNQESGAPLAALQREAQRFESLYGLRVNVFAPHAPRLRGAAAKAVLHMVNEALTNARRHTAAKAVTVLLDVEGSDVLLRLRNDHGPTDAHPGDFVPRSIKERATELGGGVQVHQQADFTEVAITLPLLGAIA